MSNSIDLGSAAVLGLGRMGKVLATTLVSAGYRTTVWNRSPAKATALREHGAHPAANVAEAVTGSDVTVLCLLDPESVRETLAPVADRLAGRTLINLTSGTPADGRDLAEWAARHGARYLDGAIMAVPEQIGGSTGFLLYSGDAAVFDDHRTLLETFGPAHFLGSDPDLAERQNLALLGTSYGALAGFLHAVALLRGTGVSAEQFTGLAKTWLIGIAEFLPTLASEIDRGDYSDAASTVAINKFAVDHIVRISEAEGIDPAVHRPLQTLIDRRLADGGGEDSFASLVELLARQPEPAAQNS